MKNNLKLKGFFESMAGQFNAGRQIIEPLRGILSLELNNQINRDIDSFCVEATRWFGPEFNEKEFKEIAYSN